MVEPQHGDLIRVEWVDIKENPVGNPKEASLPLRTSFGLFWGSTFSRGVECMVTTTTLDEEGEEGQQGYCIYPRACIIGLRIIKKKRRKKEPPKNG